MTTSLLPYAFALLAGCGVGVFYLFGLRLTLRLAKTARRPVPIMLASFLLRTAVAGALFIRIGGADVYRFLLALVGFILARLLVALVCAPAEPPQKVQTSSPEIP